MGSGKKLVLLASFLKEYVRCQGGTRALWAISGLQVLHFVLSLYFYLSLSQPNAKFHYRKI